MKLSTLAAFAVGLSTGVVGLASNPDYALDVSDNGRYFVSKSTSEPFFWQADTIWTLFHRYNLTEVEIYLDDRAKKGYTMLLTVALVMFGAENPNRNGDLPLIDYDVARPNEAYWAHVDTVYEMAWERGIRIAFVPSWGYYIHDSDNTRGFGNVTIDESNGYAFGKWFGERYPDSPFLLVGDTNNCWTDKGAVSGNYSRGGIPPASATQFTDYTPVYDAMARGLQDGSGHHDKTLITGHPTNQWFTGCPLAVSSDMFPQSQWLTFDACQSGHADYPPNPPIPWWNARRGWEPIEYMYNQPQARPVLDNEPHYENRFNNGKPGRPAWNASDIRRGSYQAVFSGAAGVVYGNDNIMQGYIPGLFDHSGSGPANSWADDLHLAGSQQVSLVQKVFKDRESLWPNYVPDSSFLIPPEGSLDSLGRDDNRTMGVRASDNSAIMVYTPLGGDVWVDWSCVDVGPSGNVLAQWFDPVEGGYTAAKVPAQSPGNFTTPASDSHSDWVLVVEQGQA